MGETTAENAPPIYEVRTYTNGRRTVTCLHRRWELGGVGMLSTNPVPERIFTEQRVENVGFHVPLPAKTPEEALNLSEEVWVAAIKTTFAMVMQKLSAPRLAVPRHMVETGGG